MVGEDKKEIVGKVEWHVAVSSPYYLGSGGHPGNTITHVIFTGDNYVAWVRHDNISPCSPEVRLCGWVNSKTHRTGCDTRLGHRTLDDVSWLLRSMDSRIAGTIPLHDNAKFSGITLNDVFAWPMGLAFSNSKLPMGLAKFYGDPHAPT